MEHAKLDDLLTFSSLKDAFEARAIAAPGERAIGAAQTGWLMMSQLDAWADSIAEGLRGHGVTASHPVALAEQRSPLAVATILAIWKLGGVYVPLARRAPWAYQRFMIEDCGANVVVGAPGTKLGDLPAGCRYYEAPSTPPAGSVSGRRTATHPINIDAAAWVLYTSGSTGRPKGVIGSHRGSLNRCRWIWRRHPYQPGEVAVQNTALTVVDSVWEIWGPLAQGHPVLIPEPDAALDPRGWIELLARHRVTRVCLVPTYLRVLLDATERLGALVPDLRQWVCSGEPLTAELARQFKQAVPHGVLLNQYGLTESCADVTSFDTSNFTPEPPTPLGLVPVGRGIDGVELRIVDEEGLSVPSGTVGELWLAGEALAHGYVGLPELTAQRFVNAAEPVPGGRWLRTGDLARMDTDGVVTVLGRADRQVKVRGLRVELEGIEATMSAHPGVLSSTVKKMTNGRGQLVGYVTARADHPGLSGAEVRDFLRERLPDHMVPAAVVVRPRFDLTPSGKIDYAVLPAIEECEEGPSGQPPPTPVERELSDVWRGVLGVPAVGSDDDFFALGGDSLLLIRMLAKVERHCGLRVAPSSFLQSPTLGGLSRLVQAEPSGEEKDAGAARPETVTLTHTQEMMWFQEQASQTPGLYNIASVFDLSGAVDLDALRAAVRSVVDAHEALRTHITPTAVGPVCRVASDPPNQFHVRRLAADAEGLLAAAAEQEAHRPFDLERDSQLRVLLIERGPDRSVLVITVHHLSCDGHALGIVFDALSTAYAASLEGRAAELPRSAVTQWSKAVEPGERKVEADASRQLFSIAADRARPPQMSSQGADLEFDLDAALVEGLNQSARTMGVTLFVLALAAFARTAQAHSGENIVTISVPLADRHGPEDDRILGCLMRVVPLTFDLSDDPTVGELAARVQAAVWEAHEDTRYGGASVRTSGLLFAFDDLHDLALNLPGIELRRRPVRRRASFADLFLSINRASAGFVGRVEYAIDLFDEVTVAAFVRHFITVLETVAAAPAARCSEVQVMAADELHDLLKAWSGEERPDYPLHRTLDSLIAEQTGRTPDSLVGFAGELKKHRELLNDADRLAVAMQRRGIGTGDVVGVHLDRSFELITTIIAVLRAGAAYLPLEPDQPPDRLRQFVDDARAALVVTSEGGGTIWSESHTAVSPSVASVCALRAEVPETDARPLPLAMPDAAAYVIFTSGSTGRPKGVAVSHRSVVNELTWMQETFRLGPEDCYLHKTSIGFDVSVWGLFMPFLSGARMEIAAPGGHQDMEYLAQTIESAGVTILDFVPTVLRLFIEHVADRPTRRVRKLLCIGEALPSSVAERARQVIADEVYNLYGPTEAAVHVTWWPCVSTAGAATVPIGWPIANTQVYVEDRSGSPVPVGVPGELSLSGPQVALGYVSQPDLTAERFPPDRFRGSGRLYRTGDLARWHRDGYLEFLGRLDRQVKVAGQRIEPAEIEAVLRSHAEIADALVVAKTIGGATRLVAYLIAEEGCEPSRAELQEIVRAKLPLAALPGTFVELPAFPRLSNGKVDLNALPAPSVEEAQEPVGGPSTGGLRARILRVLAGAVGTPVSPERSFIQCGGDSFGAIRAAAELSRTVGITVSPHTLLKAETLAEFMELLDERVPELRPRFAVASGEVSDVEVTSLQQERWVALADHGLVDIYCEITGPLRLDILERAAASLARRHRVFSSVFREGEPPCQSALVAGTPMVCTDLRSKADSEKRGAIAEAVRRCRTPFDILREPPIALEALQLSDEQTLLMGRLHHIATDGWSNNLMLEELETAYQQIEAHGADDRPLPPQYSAFARAQRAFMSGGDAEDVRSWWRERFAGLSSPTRLPICADTNEVGHANRARFIVVIIPPEKRQRLEHHARLRNGTLFTALLAAFGLMLRDATGEEDLVFGTSVAGRHQPGAAKMLGVFVNPLPIRARLDMGADLRAVFDGVRDDFAALLRYQDYALIPLVREVPAFAGLGLNDVFDAHIVFQNFPAPARIGPRRYSLIDPQDGDMSEVWGCRLGESRIMRPLDLVAFDRPDSSISLNFGYRPRRLHHGMVQSWSEAFVAHLEKFIGAVPV